MHILFPFVEVRLVKIVEPVSPPDTWGSLGEKREGWPSVLGRVVRVESRGIVGGPVGHYSGRCYGPGWR